MTENPDIRSVDASKPMDPYSANGRFAEWIREVTPDSPKVRALTLASMQHKLIATIFYGEVHSSKPQEQEREIAIATAAFGALQVQEAIAREKPGYVEAEEELESMTNNGLMLYEQHLEEQRYPGFNELDIEYRYRVASINLAQRLESIRNEIVNPV